MKTAFLLILLCLSLGVSAGTSSTTAPSTTNNDDSCDIGVFPAATLLLPYFEVDINSPQTIARTTLFSVVNHSHTSQIARVTLWSDLAYPVLEFNLFLTGYDVQSINLYDVVVRGAIPATSSSTAEGDRSLLNGDNPNFIAGAIASCAAPVDVIPASILSDVRTALTTGRSSVCGNAKIGETHANASGYVTIDVAGNCTPKLPTDNGYFDELLYDNVLSGDYEWLNPNPATGNYAGGNPMVHIRAIPEGGAAGVVVPTNLPYTFYDRYTRGLSPDARAMDRRQPLPAIFSTRFIQGGPGAFNTDLHIWREGLTSSASTCADFALNDGKGMPVRDIVRFDEHENPTIAASAIAPEIPPSFVLLPATWKLSTSSALFPPQSTAGDLGGWLYLNLNNGGSAAYTAKPGRDFAGPNTVIRPSQNWVVTSMSAEGRYQVAFDAVMLSNGCTPALPVTTNTPANPSIAPGPNITP